MRRRGKKLHECAPGELAASAVLSVFQASECRRECGLYAQSADETHLWRAWRIARCAGDIPPGCLKLLVPMIDQIAATPRNPKRAEQRAKRSFMLAHYYELLSLPADARPDNAKSISAINKLLAKEYGTTAGAVKQTVMEFEGRGQRGKKSG